MPPRRPQQRPLLLLAKPVDAGPQQHPGNVQPGVAFGGIARRSKSILGLLRHRCCVVALSQLSQRRLRPRSLRTESFATLTQCGLLDFDFRKPPDQRIEIGLCRLGDAAIVSAIPSPSVARDCSARAIVADHRVTLPRPLDRLLQCRVVHHAGEPA